MTSQSGKVCGASLNAMLTTQITAGAFWRALHRLFCCSEESFGERKGLPCRGLRNACFGVACLSVVVTLEEYYSERRVYHADVCGMVRGGLHERCCHSGESCMYRSNHLPHRSCQIDSMRLNTTIHIHVQPKLSSSASRRNSETVRCL
jgi:hypothetical protein